MLGKLLKYEYRALSRTLLPLFLGVLLVGFAGGSIFNLQTQLQSRLPDMIGVMGAFSTMLGGLALVIAGFVGIFVVLSRFYTNFFTDEGYLTHTLPVRPSTQLLAKVISGGLWVLTDLVVCFGALFLFILIGSAGPNEFFSVEILKAIPNLLRGAVEQWAIVLQGGVYLVVWLIALILMFYLAVTFGCIIAKKHKVVASFGFYIAIYMVTNTISSILTLPLFLLFPSLLDSATMASNPMLLLHLTFGLTSVMYAGIAIVSFFICKHMITKKLNLE